MGTFSIGIKWDYYDKEQKDNPLFVTAKYKDLKEEILNYKYINIKQYRKEILPKANAFYQTKLVQSMKSDDGYSNYGIRHKEVLSKDGLMSIILYTDYSALSSHFSSTFRKSTTFEPVQATKKRHRNYYWMSKLLRETVTVYGQNNNTNIFGATADKLGGPFFCGVSMVLTMPQFNITLFSPTYSSNSLENLSLFWQKLSVILVFLPKECKLSIISSASLITFDENTKI